MFAHDDPAGLPPEQLAQELAEQAARVDAGLCRLVELVAECERRLPLALDHTGFSGWLGWWCALLPRQAREYARIGARLRELPLVRERFRRGELSLAKVAALTRVADPDSEQGLVTLAEGLTASQLQRAVGAFQRVTRDQAADRQEKAYLHYQWADDGMLALRARLAADDGALVLQALDKGRDALREPRPTSGDPTDYLPGLGLPAECRVTNADALVAMADMALSRPTGERSGGDRYQVSVHVDAATLAADHDGRCELDNGKPLASETARRITCDASIIELVGRDGEPLSLGRKRRTVSPALRRAVKMRDRGCRFPGCTATRFVDAHHIQHWSQGGETNLGNLLSLCSRHHTLVHEQGYTIRIDDDGEAHFTNEYGVAVENVPRPPPSHPEALHDQQRDCGLEIDHTTCEKGAGDRMDLGLAVDALFAVTAR